MKRWVCALLLLLVLVSRLAAATTPQRALISGVPRYYQLDMRVGGSCWFPSGCGPVAGAAVCAWWDKRGFPNLIDDGQREADGLPQAAIVDLGAAQYMNRDTSCAVSWVLPENFAEGLEEYMNDHLGPRAAVARFEVTRYRITDSGYELPETGETGSIEELFAIVRDEIWNGRPMVYLYRYDGSENADGTFKVADHYAVVVGYDQTDGSRRLVIQANQSDAGHTAVTGYQNVYIGSNRYLRLGDHTRSSAVVKVHLYAIRPVPASAVEIGKGADPLLLDSAAVENVSYHVDGYDGVATGEFEPKGNQSDVFAERLWHDGDDWGRTREIILQDGIAFVAGWRSADASASGSAAADAHPNFEPVYVRTHVDMVSADAVRVTLFVELRNLKHAQTAYSGPLDVTWERVTTSGPIRLSGSVAVGSSATQAAPVSLYPDVSTTSETWSGQSTLYLEHTWQLRRDDWEAGDGFIYPFAFNVTADPDAVVTESDETNNLLTVTIGSWSPAVGFGGSLPGSTSVCLSPQVRDRLAQSPTRLWRMTPLDASLLGDADFSCVDLGGVAASTVAAALSGIDQGDLFTVAVADYVFVDLAH
ncbi:MAG: hypothetical protein AB1778_06040 [Candidatus Bipolaricaulota bacterium]